MKMKPKIFVARPIPEQVEQYLSEHCTVTRAEGDGKLDREQFFAAISDVEGLLTSGSPINAELFDHAPKLRIVSNISVGYNNFDTEEMKARRILGTHTPKVLDDTVADLIIGLMISVARRIPELDHLVRQGLWKKGPDTEFFGLDVHHRTVGIIGMGRIGAEVANRAKFGFGMDILYHNRSRNEAVEERFEAAYCSMDELLGRSDFVLIMTPLTKETERFFSREHFAKMKPTAFFINASRGQVVDEQALIEALQSGTIRGAGLDVFEVEPIQADNPLISLKNTVLVPHIGSATAATRADMAMLAARNLVEGLSGRKPPNLVPELQAVLRFD
jgi:gluconate 2-dehydrogenase